MNKSRRQKLWWVLLLLIGVGLIVGLLTYALRQNINLFYTPSQVRQGVAPVHHTFRVGGMVVKGSVVHDPKSLLVSFVLSDTANVVSVQYQGALPDLFREGQGVVCEGSLNDKGVFVANTVLAKHDENYMPPEVKAALDTAPEGALMIPELSHLALIIAFLFAILQMALPLLGFLRARPEWSATALPFTVFQAFFVTLAYAGLTYAFISNDFSVAYVAQNSAVELPLYYRICAVWGAHEGSVLLWTMLLSWWSLFAACASKQFSIAERSRLLAVLGFLSVGFLSFILFTSNPFWRLLPESPMNGHDLNPLLQDPGFSLHPPMLYMGYVGFAIAFAMAVTALLSGKIDADWAKKLRPWVLASWSCLTIGITLGSWWSYRVLGWGGFWFWDPVENASLLPWLVGTALIHSLIVTEKREQFKAWSLLLALLAFSFSIMGTFLVRSGVLTSVHAFAVDPKRGIFILSFLLLVVGSAFTLYMWRVPTFTENKPLQKGLVKENVLLLNNVLLFGLVITVMLGTLYPLILSVLDVAKLSVGAPYFNSVSLPFFVLLMMGMGLAPHVRWQQTDTGQKLRNYSLFFLLCFMSSALIPWVFAHSALVYAILGVGLSAWVIASSLMYLRRVPKVTFAVCGMVLAHIGIAISALGITLSSAYNEEQQLRMQVGDVTHLHGFNFEWLGTVNLVGPNYHGVKGNLVITKNDKVIVQLAPEKRIYDVSHIPMTRASISPGISRDLYVALGDSYPDGSWSLRIYYKPLVRWIWAGGVCILFGGLMALLGTRRQVAR